MTAEEYNARSMAKLGWTREHLGLAKDASLCEVTAAVREFQEDQDLSVDGLCGPNTWRRLQTQAEYIAHKKYPDAKGFIRCGGVLKPVPFHSIPCSPDSAFSLIGHSHSSRRKSPTQVVWHWDAALSSESCYKILKRRNVSCHGGIDNDGTFIQFLDFEDHVGWHAGHHIVNKRSIGFEITNAVYLKYQDYYEKRWGARPVWTAKVHNRTPTFLGFYASQINTCTALSKFIHEEFGVPLEHPSSTTVIENPGDFKGHIAHFHVTERKWDVAGFPFDSMLEEAGK